MTTLETSARAVTGAIAMLGLALLVAPAGCYFELPIGRDDEVDAAHGVDAVHAADAADADDPMPPPPTRLCAANGTSTVTGRGPGGPLHGHRVFVNVRGGECRPAVELVLSPEPVLTAPYHPQTVVIVASTPADLLVPSADLIATLPATIIDRAGQAAVEGRLEILGTTGVDSSAAPRLHAIATFDAAEWQLTATVDATYCLVDACPTPIDAPAGREAMRPPP